LPASLSKENLRRDGICRPTAELKPPRGSGSLRLAVGSGSPRVPRRRFLQGAAAGLALTQAVPVVESLDALVAVAASPPANLAGSFSRVSLVISACTPAGPAMPAEGAQPLGYLWNTNGSSRASGLSTRSSQSNTVVI